MPAARPPGPKPRKKLSFVMSSVACGRPTMLVGDGWCAFRNGGVLLDELLPPGWGEGST